MKTTNITYLEKIIHEMNSPLQNLSIIPDLMLDDRVAMSPAEQKESLYSILDSTKKLIQLTKMLSTITNLQSEQIDLNRKQIDLVELINKEIRFHTTHIKRDNNKQLKIFFNNKTQKANCKAFIDEFWFRQLLANLLINAINHMEKGEIEICLDVSMQDNISVLQLNVIDQGCGIPQNELDNIFKPLHRGSHSIGKVTGSGIGLAVTKEVVEAHGGSISVKNNEKGGATFEVTMPMQA